MEKITSSRIINKNIDLSILPHKEYNGKMRVDWKNSIGLDVNFVYDDIIGTLKILEEHDNNVTIFIDGYTDETGVSINKSFIRNCNLGTILKKRKVFLYEVGDIINHLKIIERIKLKEKSYKYMCMIDGYEGIVTESSLKHGASCPVCANQKIKIGVNDLWTINPKVASWLLDEKEGYTLTAHTHKKVNWKCNVCGNPVYNKTVSSVTNNNHIFCEHCSQGLSYPEKFFIEMLNQLKIKFQKQYSPDWAGKYLYDFYIIENNIEYIIEVDGGFHFVDNNMSGKTKEESKMIDDKKDDLAHKHGIYVIRIDCNYGDAANRYKYIKNNILTSKLARIFDLSMVNFEKCHEYASSSLYLEAINLFNDGLSLPDICEKLCISLSTLRNYLKDGTTSNLCKYDSGYRRIPIYCPSTKQAFASSTILHHNSEQLFGVKLRVEFKKDCNIRKCHGITFERISKKQFNKIKEESPELAFGDSFIL